MKHTTALTTAFFLMATIMQPVTAQEPVAKGGDSARPKVGLVLSGGAAFGISHIGVLKALEELRVPVDYIAGTSMGSIVGGLYASGMPPEEIERWFREADWHYLLSDSLPRESESLRTKDRGFALNQGVEFEIKNNTLKLPAAFVSGRNIMASLRKLTVPVRDVHDFNHLPIPFRAIATDIQTGNKVVMGEGDLVQCIRASMSIPAIFLPVERDGKLLADGGSASNLPISTAQDMGADVIIAVDATEALKKADQLDTADNMALQVVSILLNNQMDLEKKLLKPDDVLLRTIVPDISAMDFAKGVEGIAVGYAETMKSREKLSRLSLTPEAYERYLSRQRLAREEAVMVDFVKVRTPDGRVTNHPVRRPFNFLLNDEDARIHMQDIVADLGEFHQYDVGDYEVIEEGGSRGLLITAREPRAGRHQIHFGLDFGYSSTDEGDYNLLLAHRMTDLNRWGAEWVNYLSLGTTTQIRSEWYQPLDPERRFFVAVHGLASSSFIDARSEDDDPMRFRQKDYIGGVDVGMRLWQAGEFRVGYAGGSSEIHRRLGVPDDVPTQGDRGWLHADLSVDTLDSPNFATQGFYGQVSVAASRRELGDVADYTRLYGQVYKPLTFGKNTIVPRISGSVKLDGDDVPLYDQGSLGGFLNLSGLAPGVLFGESYAVAELVYYRKVMDLNPSTGRGIYAGFSAEYGEVWGPGRGFDLEEGTLAGSIFLGADTVFGGLYLGAGVAEGGDVGIYLQLGRLFDPNVLRK
ncbi:NTE family protein [Roseimicrobium gellanilyticum]|uniref:NTE family protein n=1 Tax=Roseimicrobium gellanilyticum TaxID=748857 RepID=A0A366HV44_9BACT|nr:patatin-like phospholipase family protein [Roseimicrobium gellanilyticum]RBP47559.1 NTE family protein [Roseimicrobium gellanilyticum]